MVVVLVLILLLWLINNIASYSLVFYPFFILINFSKYLTWAFLALIIIFVIWCFGDE
jgi:hypothetical protein